jgi:hypothetical protein
VTLPIPSTVFADGELTNEASWYLRIFSAINSIYTQAGGTNFGEAEGTTGNSVTLASGAGATSYLVPAAAVTATITTAQRRLRGLVTARVQSGSATGDYTIYVAWVAGAVATLTGVTLLGLTGANAIITPGTGASNAVTARADHTVLLTTGTYTFFPVVQKAAGGSATDIANLGYCALYDAGGS